MKVLVNSCTGRVRDVVKILRCVYIRNKFRPNFSVGVYTSLSPLVTSLVSLICVLWGKKRGQRFCTLSRHRVSVEDCTFPDGSVRLIHVLYIYNYLSSAYSVIHMFSLFIVFVLRLVNTKPVLLPYWALRELPSV